MTVAGAAEQRIGWAGLFAYGVGAIASAAKTAPVNIFLMLYYNQVIGLPALAVSSVLMIALLFDAVFDPIVGQISDNCRSRWGRRLPFMYASALPVAAFFVLLWTPPADWPQWAVLTYLAVCVIGLRLTDTFFDLPHVALIPELSSDYHERTRLFTIRSMFETAGGIAIISLAYNVFMKEQPDGAGGLLSRDGYPTFAWVTGGIILATMLLCTVGVHRRLARPILPPRRKLSPGTLFKEMAATLNNRNVAVLAAAAVCLSIGSGIGNALSTYWLLYYYQFSQAQMTLLVAPLAVGMVLTAAAPALSSKLGKRNAAIALCWVYVAAVATPILARAFDLVSPKSPALLGLVMLQSLLAPTSIVMVLVILSSMIADLVEDAEVRTGRRAEGLLLAANCLVRKATMGLGTLGAGMILAMVSFPQGAERSEVPTAMLLDMAVLYLAVKVVLFALMGGILLQYRYDRAAHEATLRQLKGRAGTAPSPSSRSAGGAFSFGGSQPSAQRPLSRSLGP
ncbi:MFS transporter [Phenylobacterium sp. LjRoot219]|uniref:MFS transporter n=1 Tax=Phenylobacterium sp. LjRoot219 TaxID=3342283 RepID=UPI003ECD238B